MSRKAALIGFLVIQVIAIVLWVTALLPLMQPGGPPFIGTADETFTGRIFSAVSFNFRSGETSIVSPRFDPMGPLLYASLLMLAADNSIHGWTLWAAIVILCREILVSGLREYLAALRVSVPVTKLAKWKTTMQLIAIGFLIAGEAGEQVIPATTLVGIVLLWLSAIFTIYTGWDYFRAGIHHLIQEDEG